MLPIRGERELKFFIVGFLDQALTNSESCTEQTPWTSAWLATRLCLANLVSFSADVPVHSRLTGPSLLDPTACLLKLAEDICATEAFAFEPVDGVLLVVAEARMVGHCYGQQESKRESEHVCCGSPLSVIPFVLHRSLLPFV